MAKTIEPSVNQTLRTLRGAEFTTEPSPDRQVSPNVFFSWDTSDCHVEPLITSQPGEMLRVTAKIIGLPRWWCFNVALEHGQFLPGDVLGIVAEIAGPAEQKIDALIRTRRIKEDGSKDIGDTELKDVLTLTGSRNVSVIQHAVQSGQNMAGSEGFHTLIMRLPMVNPQEITVFDMQIFHVSADQATADADAQKTLANFRT
ncbi:hypothetical protein Q4577_22170 [Marinovum sp. 2_MG-2023]|uniref:hypothetical protein n=1 Tax=unclassified Marinovum TaxID=2647166 RepID=UPI0026E12CE0|nr:MULTISPECIES: hypothetical protein [unclassified Marinovum]MDO6732736.1 hypothetical protein [Marinovum sp. 2_MG-2023]MDO6782010.1 hypothetical protein [Marinovum sp. 1_MG-2023]